MDRQLREPSASERSAQTAKAGTELRPESGSEADKRLDAARTEFRNEWHAKVIRRERRLSWALKGIAFTRAAAERLAVVAVICAVGIWAAYRLPAAPFALGLAFTLGMVLACGLFLLALGLSILFEHLAVWLHERPVEHF